MNFDTGRFIIKIAETSEELHAAQRLRYKVFVEEMGANVADDCHTSRMEYDKFDQDFDHLILIDSLNRNTCNATGRRIDGRARQIHCLMSPGAG